MASTRVDRKPQPPPVAPAPHPASLLRAPQPPADSEHNISLPPYCADSSAATRLLPPPPSPDPHKAPPPFLHGTTPWARVADRSSLRPASLQPRNRQSVLDPTHSGPTGRPASKSAQAHYSTRPSPPSTAPHPQPSALSYPDKVPHRAAPHNLLPHYC